MINNNNKICSKLKIFKRIYKIQIFNRILIIKIKNMNNYNN